MHCLPLNLSFEPAGEPSYPFAATPVFEFDADAWVPDGQVFIVATTPQGSIAARGRQAGPAWRWERSNAAQAEPGTASTSLSIVAFGGHPVAAALRSSEPGRAVLEIARL